jgi:competence protein ComEC
VRKQDFFSYSFKAQILLCALCLWVFTLMESEILKLLCALISLFLLYLRFCTLRALLLFGSAALLCFGIGKTVSYSDQMPPAGVYEIAQVKTNYALAKKEKWQVVLYAQEEEFCFSQTVQIASFQILHSKNNPGVFSFSSYANGKGIYYSAESFEILEEKGSIKDSMYHWIKSLPENRLLMQIFYGIETDETKETNALASLGLPFLGMLYILEKLLQRYLEQKPCSIVLIFLALLLLCFFKTGISLIRYVFMKLIRLFCEDRMLQQSLFILLVCLFFPYEVSGFGFVFPAAGALVSGFYGQRKGKKLLQSALCAFLQMLYFQKVDLVLLTGFSLLRSLYGALCLMALITIPFPAFASLLEKGVNLLSLAAGKMVITGILPFWFAAAAGTALFYILLHPRQKTVMLFAALLAFYPVVWKMDPFFHVYMIDCGQGDAAVIVEPFQQSVIMIDAAANYGTDMFESLYLPFFQSRQIEKIDYLIVTHDDSDHSGSVQALQENFEVKNTITDSSQSIETEYPFVLLAGGSESEEQEENDKSLISYFAYDGFGYLFTGDASASIEKKLMESAKIKADILKLGHHGSKTSSSTEFLEAVKPELALISSGFQNRYGHPDEEVLERLNQLGIDRLNTTDHGLIHLQSLPGMMLISTAENAIAFLRPQEDLKD